MRSRSTWLPVATRCCLGFAAVLIATLAWGDEKSASTQAVLLDTIVVTATKTADEPLRTGDVNQAITPVMTTIIKREAFEGKIESLAEVIEKEMGVQVRQSGGLGSFSSVSLRGSSSEQVLVYLDGILLNDASGGGVDLSTISLGDVAAIDIYRGATPINFGSASVGGAVNIRTLRAKKGFDASLSGGYGSFKSRKLNAFINHKPGRGDYLVSGDYLAADNDFEILNDNGTQWNTADDRLEKRNNAQVEQGNLLVKAGYDASETLRLDLMNQFFAKDQGIPSWDNSPATQSTLETIRNISTAKLTADDLTAAHLDSSTTLTYTWKEEEYDDRGGHIGLDEQHTTYTTDRLNADGLVEWIGEWQSLIGTVNLHHETYSADDHLDRSHPGESRRTMASIGLQDSFFLFDETLIVTPAARYTWIDDRLGADTSNWGTIQAEQRRRDSYLTPQIGLVYNPLAWLTFKSNLAKYVRQPSFFELFGDRGLFVGNPELKEERGVNFDIGAQCRWMAPLPGLERLSLSLAYFRIDADDLITRVYDSRGVGKSENVSGALTRGIEAGAIVEFLHHFRVIVNLTHQDPENRSDIRAFDGKRLPGRFEDALHQRARVEARHAGFTVYAETVKESGMYYDTPNLLPAADKEEINAGLAWAAGPWQFQIEGRNLSDKRYEDFNGFPLPGRSVYASVKYTFSIRQPNQ